MKFKKDFIYMTREEKAKHIIDNVREKTGSKKSRQIDRIRQSSD